MLSSILLSMENTYDVEASQHELADAYIDAGADLIIGDHSHCLQGFEYRNEVPVLYSLGNFWFNSKNLDTGMLKVTVSSGNILNNRFRDRPNFYLYWQ